MKAWATAAGRRAIGGASGLVLIISAGQAGSAGFEVPQRGIKEMGVAYTGSAALLEDASAVANNPAGLMRLEGHNISGGLTLIRSGFDYDVEVHRELVEGVGGTVPGKSDGSISATSLVPHVYYAQRIADNAAVGFGIYAPFGSTTDYPGDWAGRYHATETDITAINFNPVFAWQPTSTLSIGAGAVVQYLDAEFRNKIDLGYLVADQVIQQIAETEGPAGAQVRLEGGEQAAVDALAHQYDVDNTMEVDSWAYGFNFGVLWEPTDATRIGFNFQSRIRHSAEGRADRPETTDAEFRDNLESTIAGLGLEANILGLWIPVGTIGSQQPESAADGADRAVGPLGAAGGRIGLLVDMPETATLSFYHDLTPRWALTGGVTWTRWSRIEELRFTYTDSTDRGGEDYTGGGDDVRRRDLVQPFAWEDTWRYGVGVIFRPNRTWTLRAGVAYDESPVPDAERRTPRGPDSDRIIGAVGAGWQATPRLSVDMAYAYTHFRSSEINNSENPAGSQHRMEGDYDGHLHSVGAQVNYAF
ncbi:MAG: outer membrane protein transport protein [Ectothiorhodospiraceae bacterium]|nr:outer membrane protein transport protein [Ectothiorhodospiraceae bacterium]